MPAYTFRANENTPQGALDPVSLELRVLASLEDALQDGVAVEFDWHSADVGTDEAGEYVRLEVVWPDGMASGGARDYIDRYHVTID